MTCEDCEKIQNLAFNKNISDTVGIAYVRIEEANIAVVGCEKHLKILLKRLEK